MPTAVLRRYSPHAKQKYRATLVLRKGAAAQEILAYLREHDDIDLVVMATYGLGGVARLMMGSVADKILRAAPCPVVTIRASEAAETEAGRAAQAASLHRRFHGASCFDASFFCTLEPSTVTAARFSIRRGVRDELVWDSRSAREHRRRGHPGAGRSLDSSPVPESRE